MILEFPNYVSREQANELSSAIRPFTNNENMGMTYNRDGATVSVSSTEELAEVDKYLCSVFTKFQNSIVKHKFRPPFQSGDSGYEYHLYSPGQICHPHYDGEIALETGQIRYATTILFLTDNDDGGLVFPSQNIEIKPTAGKMVVFPPHSWYVHYSKPAKEDREIIMTWFIYDGVVPVHHVT